MSIFIVPLAGATQAPAADEPYVDDGRYDYGLSQPTGYGVKCEYNIEIPMRDGIKLRGDIYRPDGPGSYPVIVAEAPFPRAMAMFLGVDDNGGVGGKYWRFEQANPEYWVPRGYIYISFSPRGFENSEGKPSALDYQEAIDFYDAIEWAAVQPWSDGNIGLYGISYYALSQYWVSGLHPPHLKAIVPWEGLSDFYRDLIYRGGIPCMFSLVLGIGLPFLTGNLWTSPYYLGLVLEHPLCDDVWEYGMDSLSRPEGSTPSLLDLVSEIEVPMLSVGNLNDPDMHLRGNVYAFKVAKSTQKKLLLFTGTHWGSSFQPWANRTVLRFFDHYLKGIDTGIEEEPAVDVQLRTASDTFTHIYSDTWPLEQTEWTKYYLDAGEKALNTGDAVVEVSAEAQWKSDEYGNSERVTFLSEPLAQDVQVAGPLSAHFWVSSSTRDVDLTVELHDFDENGNETCFAYYLPGAPDEPVTRGWLRASLRALDPERSEPHQPFYSFSENDWLTPGVPVPVDVELWPSAMVFKAGHRIGLTVHCGTHIRSGEVVFGGQLFPGLPPWFLRIPAYQTFSPDAGTVNIHTGGEHSSWLDLPVIPADPTPTQQITIQDGGYEPSLVSGQMGDRFEWSNAGDDYHSVTESSGLGLWESQLIRGVRSHNPETWWRKIPWAGTFIYRDMVCGFEGTIGIPVRVPESSAEGDGLQVELALEPPPDGIGFDVQLKAGDGTWSIIYEGILDTQITIGPLPPGSYAVRSRLRHLDGTEQTGAETGWSPPSTFMVE